MPRQVLKLGERFPYYFSSTGIKEASGMPKMTPEALSHEMLPDSNKMLEAIKSGAIAPVAFSNSEPIWKQLENHNPFKESPTWYQGLSLKCHTINYPSFGDSLVPQFELLKEFFNRYNLWILYKRQAVDRRISVLERKTNPTKEDCNALTHLKQLRASDAYQPLRSAHHVLMKELISICRDTLRDSNRYLAREGLNKIEASETFSIEVSYPALADRLKMASHSTLYRQLKRLHVAGFLAPYSPLKEMKNGKVFHGTNAPIELLINPSLLLIFDKSNPDFVPEIVLPAKTENRAPQEGLRANCNHISSLKSIGNSLIGDVRNSSQAQNAQLTSPGAKDRTLEKRTPTKCAKSQWDGPVDDPLIRSEIRSLVEGKRRTWAPEDFGGDFKKLVYARVFLLLQSAVATLWKDREIFTGTIRKTEDYLLRHYFQGIVNQEQLDKRIGQILEAIQRNYKFIQADPKNRFAVLPLEYFDVKRKPIDEEDYSGLLGQLRLMKVQQEFDEIRQRQKDDQEKRKQLTRLKKYLRGVEWKGWTKARFDRSLKWVAENTPLWEEVFVQRVAYGQELPPSNQDRL